MGEPGFTPNKFFDHPNSTTFNSFQHQNFPFPSDLISHISTNPCSAIGYLKIQKTCKYFFAKNKIVVFDKNVEYNGRYLFYVVHVYKTEFAGHSHYRKRFSIEKGFKYCPTQWLNINISNGNKPRILENFYCCNLKNLSIFEENLSLKEMDLLLNGGKVEDLWLMGVSIKDDNGNSVSCDKILAKSPNCIQFGYESREEIFTNQTFQNMNSLVFKRKIFKFNLIINNLAPDTNVLLLCSFIKKNAHDSDRLYGYGFEIGFRMENSENYKTPFEMAINEMLETWERENKPEIKIS